jgi:hypothetical protein
LGNAHLKGIIHEAMRALLKLNELTIPGNVAGSRSGTLFSFLFRLCRRGPGEVLGRPASFGPTGAAAGAP